MTLSLKIDNTHTMYFSDCHFTPFRKKPTISIYDETENTETKIASFNNEEAFKWFVGLVEGKI